MDVFPTSYRSGGLTVPLEPTAYVAVDLQRAADVDAEAAARLEGAGRALSGALVLLADDALDADLEQRLDDAAALQPAYRDPSGAITVPLPEVRIETEDASSREHVARMLDEVGDDVTVTRRDEDTFLVVPRSGRATDAIDLANRIHDEADPAMCQPRLLRLVEHPRP
jgi:hypothetical protein